MPRVKMVKAKLIKMLNLAPSHADEGGEWRCSSISIPSDKKYWM